MPLFWFCLAAIIGIFAASLYRVPQSVLASAVFVFFSGSVFEFYYFKNKYHPLLSHVLFRIPFSLLLCSFLAGMLLFQSNVPDPSSKSLLQYANTIPIKVSGTISSDPTTTSAFISAEVTSDSVLVKGKNYPVTDTLLLLLPSGFNIRYGDRIRLTGKLQRTFKPDALPISSRLARRKIFTEMAFPEIEIISYGNGRRIKTFLYRLRNHAYKTIYSLIPFPESAVLSGILLGKEDRIPKYLWESYLACGTVHIIAISGFNISIIALLITKTFRRFLNWRWAAAASAGAILFYTILVGAEPPVVRAAIMGIIALPAHQIGRRVIGIHNLTITATLMLMNNPFLLWDASFQLSFIATLSLLTIVDPIDSWISEKLGRCFTSQAINKIMPAVTILTSTIAASAAIFPILFNFDAQLSLISLIANFLIIPLQPIIMVMGGLAVLTGMFVPAFGSIFGLLTWPFIFFCNQITIRLSMSRFALMPLPNHAYWAGLFFSIAVLSYASFQQINLFSVPTNFEL
ncbi:MAG: ComEC/Rec2 family competence protein [Anaerolineaceae bacterium]|nr:ComEC/Rec2 family competence protein [Anaerolineaceae bacterium]